MSWASHTTLSRLLPKIGVNDPKTSSNCRCSCGYAEINERGLPAELQRRRHVGGPCGGKDFLVNGLTGPSNEAFQETVGPKRQPMSSRSLGRRRKGPMVS